MKSPIRTSVYLNLENDGIICFLWSVLANLHPIEIGHPNRVSHYTQYINQLNIEGFDFSYGFHCSDVQKFEKLNNLSINISELGFYQVEIDRKHELSPIEKDKNGCERVVDIL